MDTPANHEVSIRTAVPRGIAAVRATLPGRRVSSVFGTFLDQVYAASRAGGVALDGQNVFVYRDRGDGSSDVDVEFGVGVAERFPAVGPVSYSELPAGHVATTTHWGDYGRLGEAHAAIVDWCRAHGRSLAGPRWEVYGHQGPEESPSRTDVFYLLAD